MKKNRNMYITKIERNNNFHVTFSPNWIERLFGVKEKVVEYKDSGRVYVFGGGTKYIGEDGDITGNGSYIGESIDVWREYNELDIKPSKIIMKLRDQSLKDFSGLICK